MWVGSTAVCGVRRREGVIGLRPDSDLLIEKEVGLPVVVVVAVTVGEVSPAD